MEALGRLFNVAAVGDNVYVNLRDAEAVSFVCYLDGGDTYTLTEATTAGGGGAQTLATITRYYTGNGVGGVWTEQAQSAAATVTTTSATAQDCCVITVDADELSDGYAYVKLASTSTGTVVPIVHDLKVQRAPENLPALGA